MRHARHRACARFSAFRAGKNQENRRHRRWPRCLKAIQRGAAPCAFDKFQDAIAASFGGTKAQIPLEYKKRSAEYWPEAFTMPVAITAGGRDALVPAGSVVRLAGVLKQLGRKVLLIYREEGGHSSNYADTAAALEFVVTNALSTGPYR